MKIRFLHVKMNQHFNTKGFAPAQTFLWLVTQSFQERLRDEDYVTSQKNVCVGRYFALGLALKQRLSVYTGLTEHFQDSCGGVPRWLDSNTYYTAFTEGWGLYSENPIISDDTDTYNENLLQKFGMLKWQVSHMTLIQQGLCVFGVIYVSV